MSRTPPMPKDWTLGKPIHVRLPKWMNDSLRGLAASRGETPSAALRDILHAHFRGSSFNEGYRSGYREGYAKVFGENARQLSAVLAGIAGDPEPPEGA